MPRRSGEAGHVPLPPRALEPAEREVVTGIRRRSLDASVGQTVRVRERPARLAGDRLHRRLRLAELAHEGGVAQTAKVGMRQRVRPELHPRVVEGSRAVFVEEPPSLARDIRVPAVPEPWTDEERRPDTELLEQRQRDGEPVVPAVIERQRCGAVRRPPRGAKLARGHEAVAAPLEHAHVRLQMVRRGDQPLRVGGVVDFVDPVVDEHHGPPQERPQLVTSRTRRTSLRAALAGR